jgi:gas vesicle protein
MTTPNKDKDEKVETQQPKVAARRIVVQDLPAEETPQVCGRKLSTPDNLDNPNNSSRAWEQEINSVSPKMSSERANSSPSKGIRRDVKTSKTKSGSDQINVKRLLLIMGSMLGFAIIGSVVLLLVAGKSTRKTTAEKTNTTNRSVATASASAVTQSSPVETAAASVQATPTAVETVTASVAANDIKSLSEQLAAQISQKGGYAFGNDFIDLILARTHEYNSERAMGAARLYRREINKSFRDEGMNPLIGYTLAMSRSRFDANVTDKGVGIWQIPAAVARSQGYLAAGESPIKLRVPESSAQISATYTKALMSTFDAEDFMYAIACYGMSLQEAGRVQARLVTVAPDAKSRRDIMKIIRAGVLNSDQVDSVARFFAAGIVGENPQKFGLAASQPFSSLY